MPKIYPGSAPVLKMGFISKLFCFFTRDSQVYSETQLKSMVKCP